MEKIHYSRKEYREQYLRSEEWRLLSRAILLRDPVCRLCENKPSQDSHHLSYERIHHERPDDLIGICRTCHNYIHSHKELSGISNLRLLKLRYKESKQDWFFHQQIFNQTQLTRNPNVRRLVAGILKVPSDKLSELIGQKINYFIWLKIQRAIKSKWMARKPIAIQRRIAKGKNRVLTI